MRLTALVFDGVMTSDVLAPIEAAGVDYELTVELVGFKSGKAWGFEPLHSFEIDRTLETTWDTDLLLVPGGLGSIAMMGESSVLAWLREMEPRSRYVLSVSTGSLLLAAAGLLDERDASGHWLAHGDLADAGAHPSAEAVTWEGHIVTTSGYVSAAEVAREMPAKILFGD